MQNSLENIFHVTEGLWNLQMGRGLVTNMFGDPDIARWQRNTLQLKCTIAKVYQNDISKVQHWTSSR